MKTNFALLKKTFSGSGVTVLATLLVLASATAGRAALALPPSPVGQWDCIMSGAGQDGIIFLNFTMDIDTNSGLPTFEGVFVNAGLRHPSNNSNPRNPVGAGGRSPSGNANTNASMNLFGGGPIQGVGSVSDNGGPGDWYPDSRGLRGDWFWDSKGRVVGSYFTVVNASGLHTNFFQTCTNGSVTLPLTNGGTYDQVFDICFTNGPTLSTNLAWGPAGDGETGTVNLTLINNNFTITPVGLTNNVSFVGTVVPGKRLTLVGSTVYGKFNFRGVPLVPLTTVAPLDGYFWFGSKTQDRIQFGESFRMSASSDIQNLYYLTGAGPSYTYNPETAFCLVSSQRKIAFTIGELALGVTDPQLAIQRATFGNFNNGKQAIGTKGNGFIAFDPNRIQFDANLVPVPFP